MTANDEKKNVLAGAEETIDEQAKKHMLEAGFDPDASEDEKSGAFVAQDHEVVLSRSFYKGVEILPIDEALKKYDYLKDMAWSLIPPDKDDITRAVKKAEDETGVPGMFIHVEKDAKVAVPLQSCFYLKSAQTSQYAHNIYYIEDGAELHVINGCTSADYLPDSKHLSITEYFIGKNATLTFTMIHAWAPQVETIPRSGAIVEEGGLFVSNYISLKPARYVQSYPFARLVGKGARARFYSIVLAPENSLLDLGSRGILEAEDTSVEIISRTVSSGGKVIARGHIIGDAKDATGFMECNGLILGKGIVHAIPELEGRLEDLALSHEAAVGKISQEEIDYLRTRGFSEEEARALIVSGFLSVKVKGIPDALQQQVEQMIDLATKGM